MDDVDEVVVDLVLMFSETKVTYESIFAGVVALAVGRLSAPSEEILMA